MQRSCWRVILQSLSFLLLFFNVAGENKRLINHRTISVQVQISAHNIRWQTAVGQLGDNRQKIHKRESKNYLGGQINDSIKSNHRRA